VPESKLARMFSGKYKVDNVDGRAYIDRDPTVFKHMLDFLENDHT